VGTIAIEDFGSSMTYGARAAYLFNEDLFAEATVGTAKAGRTSYEDLSGSVELLTDSERQFTYYDLSVGWNALPGEVFLGGRRAMPSSVYLSLGAGSTRFAGDDHFTIALGAGCDCWPRTGCRCTRRPRPAFESDLLGEEQADPQPASSRSAFHGNLLLTARAQSKVLYRALRAWLVAPAAFAAVPAQQRRRRRRTSALPARDGGRAP
jgi:outer membrane beta-barrel protein